MKRIKVLFVFGTRPEAIKLAPVIHFFRSVESFDVVVCSASQHGQMLEQVLDFFNIPVDFDLKLMEPNQGLASLTSKVIRTLSEEVLSKVSPDWLVVQGDTTTAMASALAGFYQRIKVAHVEAGLRSHDLRSPFPEEMNRQVIARLSHCHFCPTQRSVGHLAQEGITANVFPVGNTVIDALFLARKLMLQADQEDFSLPFRQIDFEKKIVLVTCHRRESFGSPFLSICQALRQIAEADEDYLIVYPVHLNPNVLLVAKTQLQHPRIHLLEPLSYPHLLWLMERSTVILTDSGGIQEEAPSLHKPVIVLRDVTERTESIDAGTAILAGTSAEVIVKETIDLLTNKARYDRMSAISNPYGDGHASEQIAETMTRLS